MQEWRRRRWTDGGNALIERALSACSERIIREKEFALEVADAYHMHHSTIVFVVALITQSCLSAVVVIPHS